jgi:long-chain fatty acid transport protein
MTLFDSHQFSGGLNVISSEIKVSDFGGAAAGEPDAKNTANSPVPNIYYIHRLNDQWALGAGIYSNFGTNNEFDSSFGNSSVGARAFGGTTKISSINYTLNVAYRINEQWSVGGGIDIVDGQGELKREVAPGVSALDIDASGIGLGFNLGTVFELNDNNRFGLAYHHSPEIEASGDLFFDPGIAVGSPAGNIIEGHKLLLPLPSMLEFSGYHRITDSKFAVHYSLQYIGWSVFDKLTTDQGIPASLGGSIKDYEWKDGYHASLGGTYYLNENWELRAGYMFDTAAQDKLTSISVPDSDRHWFSAGFGYHFKQHHTVDFGFTYLLGQDVNVSERGGVLTATTHANAILAGIQYSYSF